MELKIVKTVLGTVLALAVLVVIVTNLGWYKLANTLNWFFILLPMTELLFFQGKSKCRVNLDTNEGEKLRLHHWWVGLIFIGLAARAWFCDYRCVVLPICQWVIGPWLLVLGLYMFISDIDDITVKLK